MRALPARIAAELDRTADITGWSYRLLSAGHVRSAQAVVSAARGGIGDAGEVRLLLVVGADHLDPVTDADLIAQLAAAPPGTCLVCEIACRIRSRTWRRCLDWWRNR
ncbi:hypothetical protein Ppa06_69990 [Planomonospora parontospora subsp. parontospora]|uniref:Uncharacterized protein n=2 Tax=Planomonospora parontospora TaxID=58119 RepID=A0AA37BN23_9ACTN|nr:hypothetical protein [Planomonospora parontospora]GGK94061.1 hypothetical protein GCM10010126_61790 [Planomonospora parontospora]GII13201.1 hypothetical protein Ppa06_69990 [Planomonospora parontospora subsp. parontospora]